MPRFIRTFSDPQRERAYRIRSIATLRRDLPYILVAASGIYALTILEHLPRLATMQSAPYLLGFRGLVLLLAGFALLAIHRSVLSLPSRILLFLYMISFGFSESYELYAGVSEWSHGAFPVIVIMILMLYFFVRFDLGLQIAAGILVAIMYTATVAISQNGPLIEYSSVALLFLLVHVIGVYHYVATENRARREFALLLEERSLTKRFREETAINKNLFEELKRRSTTDFLTGLSNRGAFEEHLQRHHALSLRHDRPLSLVLLDLDWFKQINDRYGHPAGDEVLRMAAEVLRNTARGEDMPGRLGGDELGIILPETDNDGAVATAARILEALHGKLVRKDKADEPIQASIGVTTLRADESVEEIWERTDRALYRAKLEGRDRVFNCGTNSRCTQYATI